MDRATAVLLYLCVTCAPVWAQFRQQGPKLVGVNALGGVDQFSQGLSVALSADGSTALVGATQAEWVFTRSNCGWTQQAELTGAPPQARP